MKVIFMGTPAFACPSLQALIDDPAFDVLAVYTRAPKIAGRGHKITNSAIHDLALKHNIKVITPKTLRDEEAQETFRDLKADVAVVVAYGLLLPTPILQGTRLGCVNIHPSLLPRWRGAAPIQRTIMAGDKETAIAIMQMDQGLDSGDVLASKSFTLDDQISYKDLAEKFAQMGPELLLPTLTQLDQGNIVPVKQDEEKLTYAAKIEKSECEINWQQSAKEIHQQIRGLNGCLGAYFMHQGEKIKLFEAEVIHEDQKNDNPGEMSSNLEILCGQGTIRALKLQRPGKKPMMVKEFLLGFKL